MYYKTCFRIKLPDYVKNEKTFNKYISDYLLNIGG